MSIFFLELSSYSGAKLGSLKEILCWGKKQTNHKSYKTALRTQALQGDKQRLSFINTCEGPGAPCAMCWGRSCDSLVQVRGVHHSPLGSGPSDAHSSLPQGKFPSPFWVLGAPWLRDRGYESQFREEAAETQTGCHHPTRRGKMGI